MAPVIALLLQLNQYIHNIRAHNRSHLLHHTDSEKWSAKVLMYLPSLLTRLNLILILLGNTLGFQLYGNKLPRRFNTVNIKIVWYPESSILINLPSLKL